MNNVNQEIKKILKNQGSDNVPELRFPEFKGEWNESKFEDHFEFKNTNSYSRDKLNYKNGEVLNIHYGDIHTKFNTHFDLEKEEVPFINKNVDISRISDENYVKKGDLVIADASEDYADIGKTIEITNTSNKKILAGLHTFLARKTDTSLAIGFFGQLLTNYNVRLEIMRIAQGTKVLGLSKGRFEKIPLFIPSPFEQQKIASFLTAVDERIQLLEKKKEKLEQYKKGIMQQLFSQQLRFKDDNGNAFPDWEEKKFKQLFKSISTKPYQIRSKEIENTGKYKVVDQGQNIIAGYSNESEKLFKDYDVIIYGDHTTIVKYISFEFIIGADGTKILKNKETDDLKFLYYALDFNNIKPEGYKRHFSILKTINLNIPSLFEQQKIAVFLSSIDEMIDKVAIQIEQSRVYKKGLLQKMFV